MMSEIGAKIRELRRSAKLTQEQLANKIGVEKSSIGKYETTNVVPSIDVLKKIASTFGVTVDALIGNEKEEQYYINDEVQQIAQEIHDDPNLRILFSASRKLSAEDVKFVVDMVERLKKG